MGRVNLHLYAGEAEQAHHRVVDEWPLQQRSMMARIQMVRVLSFWSRARAALARAASLPDGAGGRRPFLVEALRDAKAIEGEGTDYATAHGRLLRAGVCAASGDAAGAQKLADEAAALFDATDMALHASVARRARAALAGDAAAIAKVDQWMASQSIARPARIVAVIAPGFPPAE